MPIERPHPKRVKLDVQETPNVATPEEAKDRAEELNARCKRLQCMVDMLEYARASPEQREEFEDALATDKSREDIDLLNEIVKAAQRKWSELRRPAPPLSPSASPRAQEKEELAVATAPAAEVCAETCA